MLSAIISAVAKTLGKAAIKKKTLKIAVKKSTSKLVGKKTAQVIQSRLQKELIKQTELASIKKIFKVIDNKKLNVKPTAYYKVKRLKRFVNEYDKAAVMKRWLAHRNKWTGIAYDLYQQNETARVKQWLKELKRIERSEQVSFQREMISKYQKGEGIGYDNFRQFKRLEKMFRTPKEQEYLNSMFNEQLMLMFSSSWIQFGVYIPYSKTSTLGVLGLQLKKGSRRNPTGYYEWIRIPRRVWNDLNDKATGKQFWEKWYTKNRKNKRYLTSKSIYWEKQGAKNAKTNK